MEVERRRCLAAMALALAIEDEDLSEPKRACWMKPWMCRKDLGLHSQLFSELLVSDPDEYRWLLRVSEEQFLQLLARVGPRIERQDTVMRRATTPATRLQVTLRYLATGESHHSLSRQFRLGHSSVNDLIAETCRAVYEELKSDCLQTPKTEDDWQAVIKGFRENWQYPNCVGAMDGKHVRITKPPKSGSIYYNYLKTYSIVLFAVVDANYKFVYIDVVEPGSKGDAGVWQTTPLQRAISNNTVNLPKAVKAATAPDLLLPPVFVADDAFPIGKNIMKPFGGTPLSDDQKVFNNRLSRARRVVENVFGILANRFRCLHTVISATPERAAAIVKATCLLHNFLCNVLEATTETTSQGRGPSTATFFGYPPPRGRPNQFGAAVRDQMCTYFNGRGAVPWQREAGMLTWNFGRDKQKKSRK